MKPYNLHRTVLIYRILNIFQQYLQRASEVRKAAESQMFNPKSTGAIYQLGGRGVTMTTVRKVALAFYIYSSHLYSPRYFSSLPCSFTLMLSDVCLWFIQSRVLSSYNFVCLSSLVRFLLPEVFSKHILIYTDIFVVSSSIVKQKTTSLFSESTNSTQSNTK